MSKPEKYPYSIKFSYNKKTYTHEFVEIIYPEIELEKLKYAHKNYFGVAVLGIKDAFEALNLNSEEESVKLPNEYVQSVILFDGFTGEEVWNSPVIRLKDGWAILKGMYEKCGSDKKENEIQNITKTDNIK